MGGIELTHEAEKGPGGKIGGIVLAPKRVAKNIFVCSECPLLSGCAMQINAFLLLLPSLRGRLNFPEKGKKREEKSVDFRLSFRAKKKTSPLWTERVSRSNGPGVGRKKKDCRERAVGNELREVSRRLNSPKKETEKKKKAGEELLILQAIFILRNTAAIFFKKNRNLEKISMYVVRTENAPK